MFLVGGGGEQLKSQAVKRRVKQFCPKRLLTLTGSSFHKLYHREREKEKKKSKLWRFYLISKTAWGTRKVLSISTEIRQNAQFKIGKLKAQWDRLSFFCLSTQPDFL